MSKLASPMAPGEHMRMVRACPHPHSFCCCFFPLGWCPARLLGSWSTLGAQIPAQHPSPDGIPSSCAHCKALGFENVCIYFNAKCDLRVHRCFCPDVSPRTCHPGQALCVLGVSGGFVPQLQVLLTAFGMQFNISRKLSY